MDSERAIKKMTLPKAMPVLSWCLCLQSDSEVSTLQVLSETYSVTEKHIPQSPVGLSMTLVIDLYWFT